MKHILLAVTGGIAAYKAKICYSTRFPAIGRNPVYTNTFKEEIHKKFNISH